MVYGTFIPAVFLVGYYLTSSLVLIHLMGDDNYELVLTMGSQVKEAKCFHHAKNFERVFTDWDAIVPAFLNYMNRKWTFLNKVN
jgi:hypothetical protein